MKREIKFRAWHKDLHDMRFWDVSKGGDNIFWYTITEYPEMYNLMQFTGLTDKNGKEIYEGDIWSDDNMVGQVIFDECRFKILWTNGSKGCLYTNVTTSMNGKIIGNIYEHENYTN